MYCEIVSHCTNKTLVLHFLWMNHSMNMNKNNEKKYPLEITVEKPPIGIAGLASAIEKSFFLLNFVVICYY